MLILTVSSAGALSCFGPISRAEVTGEYVSDYEQSDTLELREEGSYVHRFVTPAESKGAEPKTTEERGAWDFHASGGEPTITFFDFSSWPYIRSSRRGFWVVRPERAPLRGRFA
jgi:hypothetical protein